MNRFARAVEALGIKIDQTTTRKLRIVVAIVVAFTAAAFNSGLAQAAALSSASVALSDPRPSQTASYTFTGSSVTSSVIKCVKVVISTTSLGTQAPTGFSGAGATVTAASSTLINSSATGWSLAKSDGTSSSGQNNIFQYTNSTGVTPSTTSGATFILGGVTNSNVQDTSYFYLISTFGNTDCATSPVDSAAVNFINTNGSTLSLSVDTSLSFTVNGVNSGQSCDGTTTTSTSTATTIPFGSVSSASNAIVCQDLIGATNSTNGYTIYARYTAKPTNALSQTIADASGSNGAPVAFSAAGTEAYGYTTNDSSLSVTGNGANRFTSPSQNWSAMTTSNAEIAYEPGNVSATTYRIGHQVGVNLTTRPGTYTTTVIYTCTPVY